MAAEYLTNIQILSKWCAIKKQNEQSQSQPHQSTQNTSTCEENDDEITDELLHMEDGNAQEEIVHLIRSLGPQ